MHSITPMSKKYFISVILEIIHRLLLRDFVYGNRLIGKTFSIDYRVDKNAVALSISDYATHKVLCTACLNKPLLAKQDLKLSLCNTMYETAYAYYPQFLIKTK